jgi:hypothetical protein
MSDAMHALSIGTMKRGLHNLAGVLDKAESYAQANGIDRRKLLEERLHPDMFSLLQQLQYASYVPCEFARHFVDVEPPRVGYDETSWEECRRSLDQAAAYLDKVTPARVEERKDKAVPLFFDEKRSMNVLDYAARVMVPDFFFHMTVAYAILRHNGVPLGKADFLGH